MLPIICSMATRCGALVTAHRPSPSKLGPRPCICSMHLKKLPGDSTELYKATSVHNYRNYLLSLLRYKKAIEYKYTNINLIINTCIKVPIQ